MADAPDLSKIVNMILENPSLVEQISAMAKGNTKEEEKKSEAPSEKPDEPVMAVTSEPKLERHIHRARLASAMKPYLSKERAQAIDTLIGIADIIDMTGGKG